jgi:hypothetical protein
MPVTAVVNEYEFVPGAEPYKIATESFDSTLSASGMGVAVGSSGGYQMSGPVSGSGISGCGPRASDCPINDANGITEFYFFQLVVNLNGYGLGVITLNLDPSSGSMFGPFACEVTNPGELTLDYTVTVSIPCTEIYDDPLFTYPLTADTLGFPPTAPDFEGPVATNRAVQLVLVPGQSLTVRIEVPAIGYDQTHTYTVLALPIPDFNGYQMLTEAVMTGIFSGGSECFITPSINGVDYKVDIVKVDHQANNVWFNRIDYLTAGVSTPFHTLVFHDPATAALTRDFGIGCTAVLEGTGQVTAGATWRPPKLCRILGSIRDFGAVWLEGDLTIQYWIYDAVGIATPAEFVFSGGEADHSWTQYDYSLSSGDVLKTMGPVSCWLKDSSLSALGDDPRDRRLLSMGRKWDAIGLAFATTRDIGHHANLTGWTGTGCTVTTPGGTVVVGAATADGASAVAAFSPRVGMESHRYMKVSLSIDIGDSVPLVIGIGGKTWAITTGTAGDSADYEIDLCCPDSSSPGGSQDSRYPIANPADVHMLVGFGNPAGYPTQEGRDTGVNVLKSLSIGGIPNGSTLTVTDIHLFVKRSVKLDIVSTFLHYDFYMPYNPTTDSAYYMCKRHLLALTDGRQSLEIPDEVLRHDLSGVSGLGNDINEVCQLINTCDGWTATSLSASGPAPLNAGASAYLLGGAGATYAFNTAFYEYWIERDISAGVTIPAQELADQINAYPGMGEWGSTLAYVANDPLVFRFVKYLRGAGHGLATDSHWKPDTTDSVGIQRVSDSSDAGSGMPDAGGYFRTGFPFAFSGQSYDFIAEPGATGGLTMKQIQPFTAFNRKKSRGRIIFSGICLCETERGRLMVAAYGRDDGVHVWRFDLLGGYSSDALVIPGLVVTDLDITYLPNGSLLLAYIDSTGLHACQSASLGDKWDAAVSIAPTGTSCRTCADKRNQTAYIAVYDTTRYVLWRLLRDGTWVNVGPIVTSSEASFDLSIDPGPKRLLTFLLSGTPNRRFVSPDMGTTWSEE